MQTAKSKQASVGQSLQSLNAEERVPLLPRPVVLDGSHTPRDTEPERSTSHIGSLIHRSTRNLIEPGAWKGLLSGNNMYSADQKLEFYDHEKLLTWRVVCSISGSAFTQPSVLFMGFSTLLIAAITCTIVLAFVPDAEKFNTKRFGLFLVFLKVFITLMLGTYVGQSFKRWQSMLDQFEHYLTNIKQMVFLLHSIKVSPELLDLIQRRVIAGTWLLNTEMQCIQQVKKDKAGSVADTLDWLNDCQLLEDDEHKQLGEMLVWAEKAKCHGLLATTNAVWAWIGELISEAQLATGAAIAAPMHVRILQLCQDCLEKIEDLKMSIVTQEPYVYAHLLSFLVFANNFLLALSCGLTLGSTAAEVHMRHEQVTDGGAHREDGFRGRVGEFYEAIQTMALQLVILVVEPMMYMAFLNIAHMLCYPFGIKSYHLPTENFIRRLHIEINVLVDGRTWSEVETERWAKEEQRREARARASRRRELDIESGDSEAGAD